MYQARSISAGDFASDCPVPLEFATRLTRAEPDAVTDLLAGIPETTRARLAVWLYGRSHTHAMGVRIAATCQADTLRQTAGLVGTILHDLSRRPSAAPSHGTRTDTTRRISLGGSGIPSAALA